MPLTIEVEQDVDGRWLAEGPELPGVLAHGLTRQEAIKRVQALSLRVLADRIEHGDPVPPIRSVWGLSVGRALTLADEAAAVHGAGLPESVVTITEELSEAGPLWRFHYGPRDCAPRRGGDLIVLVDERAGVVQRVIRGQ
jgi:predicted RNase H-like HicB family nuclease